MSTGAQVHVLFAEMVGNLENENPSIINASHLSNCNNHLSLLCIRNCHGRRFGQLVCRLQIAVHLVHHQPEAGVTEEAHGQPKPCPHTFRINTCITDVLIMSQLTIHPHVPAQRPNHQILKRQKHGHADHNAAAFHHQPRHHAGGPIANRAEQH